MYSRVNGPMITDTRTNDNLDTDEIIQVLGSKLGRVVDDTCDVCGYDRIIGERTCGLCGNGNRVDR